MRQFFREMMTACRNRLARYWIRAPKRESLTVENIMRVGKAVQDASIRAAFATPGLCVTAVRNSPTAAKKTVRGTVRYTLAAIWFAIMSVVHVFGDSFAWTLRNGKAMTLMTVSLAFLVVGFVRLNQYSVPMLRGDYAQAAKGKTEFNFADKDTGPQQEIFAEDTWFTKAVMATLRLTWKATDTVVGDRRGAKFNQGFELYQTNQYEDAVIALTKAYAALSDNDGNVKPQHTKLAAEIQFLIGNAYANKKKESEAISAYKLSLKHDPNNIITIYNLERLLASGGGKGGNDGDKPKPSSPSNTKL
jgi:tetratricopeptide (TPR) repeat protein